jgi:hypothetical protein
MMQLYTGLGPNPRTVCMFLAEKGVEIPLVPVDLMGGENRRAPGERERHRRFITRSQPGNPQRSPAGPPAGC